MKKKNKSLGEAVAVGSALAGAALGAAAVLLSDKKNQKKIKDTIDEFSKDATEMGKTLKKKAEEYGIVKKSTEKKAASKVKKTVKKTAARTKKTTGKVYTPLKK